MEACWAHNPEVDGSKPSAATFFFSLHPYNFRKVSSKFRLLASSLDSSVGRAEDCSRLAGILRSLVRIRLEGLLFWQWPRKAFQKKQTKTLPRVRLELTTFRSLFPCIHYETDALPTALPRQLLTRCTHCSQGPAMAFLTKSVESPHFTKRCCGVVVITSA